MGSCLVSIDATLGDTGDGWMGKPRIECGVGNGQADVQVPVVSTRFVIEFLPIEVKQLSAGISVDLGPNLPEHVRHAWDAMGLIKVHAFICTCRTDSKFTRYEIWWRNVLTGGSPCVAYSYN